jgi:hypothetical protein
MKKKNQKNSTKNVLFQKLGDRWYVFSEVDNDVIYSPLPEGVDPRRTKLELYEVIERHIQKVARHRRDIENAA